MTSKTKLIKVSKTNALNLNQKDVRLMVNYLKKFIKVKGLEGIKTVHQIDFKLFFENMKSAKLSQLKSYRDTTSALLNIYKQIGDTLSNYGFTEDDYYIVYLMTQTAAPHVDAGWSEQKFFSKVLNISGCEYYQFETFYTEQDFMFIMDNGQGTNIEQLKLSFVRYIDLFNMHIKSVCDLSSYAYNSNFVFIELDLLQNANLDDNNCLDTLFLSIKTTPYILKNTYNDFDMEELSKGILDPASKFVANKTIFGSIVEFNNKTGLL